VGRGQAEVIGFQRELAHVGRVVDAEVTWLAAPDRFLDDWFDSVFRRATPRWSRATAV
jgi:hypothetical protein